jgi:signal transduction histidine kinase/ActR/RegA family two-component response regulator
MLTSRLNHDMHEPFNLEQLISAALAELAECLYLDRCSLLILDPDGEVVGDICQHIAPDISPLPDCRSFSGLEEIKESLLREGLFIAVDEQSNPLARSFFTEGKDVMSNTVDAVESKQKSEVDFGSLACLLVKLEGESRAILMMERMSRRREWTQYEIDIGRLMTDRLALAFKQDDMLDDIREFAREAQALYRASILLIDTSDTDRLYKQILDAVADVFGHENVGIWLIDHSAGEAHLAYMRGEVPADIAPLIRIEGPGLLAYSVRTGSVVNVPDVSLDARYIPGAADTRSELVVPLRIEDQVVALFNLESPEAGAFTERDERILIAFADRAARAVEQSRLYRQAQAAAEIAAQSDKLRALGQIAAGVAHNFNNILAAVLGHAELLKRQVTSQPLMERIEVIEQAALDGAAIVRRIRSFSLEESEEEFRTVDINQIISESLEITRARWQDDARAHGIRYEISFGDKTQMSVAGSASELREVFVNIIFNALDAMGERGGRLLIETGEGGERVFARFTDEGKGMSDEIRNRLFEPFFTTKGAKGTGLGLSTSYAIVQRHGGSIEVKSEPQKGSSFTVWLPMIRDMKVADEMSGSHSAACAKILVVDDDDRVREALAGLLEMSGYYVTQAADGQEALAALEAGASSYEVMVTDLAMPDMDGITLARSARRASPRLKVLLMTGYGNEIQMEQDDKSCIEAIISKPSPLNEVLIAIEKTIFSKESEE